MGLWKIVKPEATTNFVRNPSAEGTEAVGSNLITNGGFETAGGGGADVFGTWSENAGDGGITDSATAQAGAHACQLTAGASANTYVYQNVTVVAGRLYRFYFYVRGDGTNSGRYRLYDVTNSADIVAVTSALQTGASYGYRELAFVAPAGCASVRVQLSCPTANGGSAYFDSISVAEVTAGLATRGAADDFYRTTTYAYEGAYSYYWASDADNEGLIVALSALTNAAHYVTMRVRGTVPSGGWDWSLNDSDYTEPTLLESGTNWSLYGTSFVAAQANGSTALYIRQDGAGSGTLYIDAIQVEAKSGYYTTYCDGDQPGCDWTGFANNSSSTRDADAWQGGREYDLADDYGFVVQTVTGADAPPVEVFGTPYAILPGEAADGERIAARDLFLIGEIYSNTSFADLQSQKAAFFDEFKHWRSGQTSRNSDPIKLRYAGTERALEIEVKYMGGFEGTHSARDGWSQQFTLHFRAQENVWWHTINRQATILDSQDSATARYIMGKVDGAWTLMGPPAAATVINAVGMTLIHNGICLYAGAGLTNFDGEANADYFWKWDGTSWDYVGSGGEGTGQVEEIEVLPDGKIVIVGGFSNWGSVAAADYAITYDPTTDSFGVLGTGPSDACNRVAIDPTTGYIYVLVGTTGVEYWDGSSWNDISPTDFHAIYDIWFTPDGTLWAGGDEDVNYPTIPYSALLQSYDGSSWTDELTEGVPPDDEYIRAGASLSDGRVVVAGEFTNLGGNTVANAAIYNGQSVDDMNGGLTLAASSYVYNVYVDPDDMIYVMGWFTAAGDIDADNVAVFNGFTWVQLDMKWEAMVYDLAVDGDDLYIGGSFAGTAYYSGDTTITTTGGRPVQPRLKVKRSGGTSATLRYLQNADTDSELWFDIDILDGETITIDFAARSITSDFGRKITGNPLPGSTGLGAFEMEESSNLLNLWVETAGSPTVTAIMDYWVNYDGYSGGDT